MMLSPHTPGDTGKLPPTGPSGQSFAVLADIATALARHEQDRDEMTNRLALTPGRLRFLVSALPDMTLADLAPVLSIDELSAIKWLWMRRADEGGV